MQTSNCLFASVIPISNLRSKHQNRICASTMKTAVVQGVCLCISALIVLVQCDTSHDIGLLKDNVEKPEKTITVARKPNRTRTHLFVFSFTIFRKGNLTRNNTVGTDDSQMIPSYGGMDENPEQTSFYSNKLHMPWLDQIPMRFLYFIASSSLLLLFLMIIKLIVSRRAKADYSLVTKGDFDA